VNDLLDRCRSAIVRSVGSGGATFGISAVITTEGTC
jgi:hypothetical protein